ncbi:MAG: nitrate/sulfonate/bicarbonate ABC transporter ATP-binding protein [Dokdonella sp.]
MSYVLDETIIDLKGVFKAFPTQGGQPRTVLDNVDLTLKSREIVGLLGRSGSGKSTLLRIIAGLGEATSGEVLYRGEPVDGPADGIAMVFQSFALFPWLTVLQNVELGLEAQGVAPRERRERALKAIDLIGLDGFESAYPKELSGGMRQRIGFARALVTRPNLLLLDEPFSALDVLTAETLRTDFLDLWCEGRMPIKAVLIVTHNIEEAVLMCDRILVFSSNPGRVVAELRVDLPYPRNRQDPAFRTLVDTIYARMTTSSSEPRKDNPGLFPGTGIGMVLPAISTNLLSGLIEAIAQPPFKGKADLPDVARSLQLDNILPIAETLQLLRLADLAEGDIRLTPAGQRFAEAEVEQRKEIFRQHLLAYVPLAAHIRRVLDDRPGHRAPSARFHEELEDYMGEDDATQTLRAIVSWGRYAEAFANDKEAGTFSLEDPR